MSNQRPASVYFMVHDFFHLRLSVLSQFMAADDCGTLQARRGHLEFDSRSVAPRLAPNSTPSVRFRMHALARLLERQRRVCSGLFACRHRPPIPGICSPRHQIYSAASDGEEETHSCRLWAYAGTSMSCPIVAGASAMVSHAQMARIRSRDMSWEWGYHTRAI